MRLSHFEQFAPACPSCATHSPAGHAPLQLARVARRQGEEVLEGVLLCSNPNCQREYPIIDGVPLIVASLREYVQEQLPAIQARDDLSPLISGMLGDCCGPGTFFDTTRQQLSTYGWDHYGDCVCGPGEAEVNAFVGHGQASPWPAPGSARQVLEAGLSLLASEPAGPILEVGCSVGRVSLELAARHEQPVLGVDLNFAMLRLASRAARDGRLSLPLRRCGVVYDELRIELPGGPCPHVDFWACDATALPCRPESFELVVGLHVLDSVPSPWALLQSSVQALRPGGQLLLACPYDWSSAVTPISNWLGGHSQRADTGGRGADVLRMLLQHAPDESVRRLEVLAEREQVPWHLRLHDRSSAHYLSHVLVARRQVRTAAERSGAVESARLPSHTLTGSAVTACLSQPLAPQSR